MAKEKDRTKKRSSNTVYRHKKKLKMVATESKKGHECDDSDILRAQVIKLSGDENDVDLMNLHQVESTVDEDFEDDPAKRSELEDFVKGLDIQKYKYIDEESEKCSVKSKKKTVTAKLPNPANHKFVNSSSALGKQKNYSKLKFEEKDKVKKDTFLNKKLSRQKDVEKKSIVLKNFENVKKQEVVACNSLNIHIDWLNMGLFKRQKTYCNLETAWYDQIKVPHLKPIVIPNDLLQHLQEVGRQVLQQEIENYEKHSHKEASWMNKMMSAGTMMDRVAAMTLQVKQNSLLCLPLIDKFVRMMDPRRKREAVVACKNGVELFLLALLPDRKLKPFKQQPIDRLHDFCIGNQSQRDKCLMLWHFEEQLLLKYQQFLLAVKKLSMDSLSHTKVTAISAIFQLLASKPEQEQTLLELLVNKLGDPDSAASSKALVLLNSLVQKHPNMRSVIVSEVERLAFRGNVTFKMRFFALSFLSQVLLSSSDQPLADKLIGIYLSIFKSLVSGKLSFKMLNVLLSGINRAFVYSSLKMNGMPEELNMLCRLVNKVNFKTSLQVLLLLYTITVYDASASNMFYALLYEKLVKIDFSSSSYHGLLLNLLFRSMKRDHVLERVQAFIKRLLQVSCHQSAAFTCGCLLLISELQYLRPQCLLLQQRPRNSVGGKVKEIEFCDDDKEIQVLKTSQLTKGKGWKKGKDDTSDIKEEDDISDIKEEDDISDIKEEEDISDIKEEEVVQQYNMFDNNPLCAHVSAECMLELKHLAVHFHPTVALFARNLLQRERIVYMGDPHSDFSVFKFLERFVFKNPKKHSKVKSEKKSVHSRLSHGIAPLSHMSVTSEQFLRDENVPVHEAFLQRFLHARGGKKSVQKQEDEDSDVSDTEFDSYLEKYERNLAPDTKVDFAGNMKLQKRKKNAEDSEDEDLENLTDEEVDFGEDFELDDDLKMKDEDLEDFVDEENMKFSDEEGGSDEFEEDLSNFSGQNENKRGRRGKADASLFASADEFSHLLEDSIGSKFDLTSSSALRNKDNASAKQLEWELKRDTSAKNNWKRRKPQGKPKNFPKRKK